jgi:hypothetical protein
MLSVGCRISIGRVYRDRDIWELCISLNLNFSKNNVYSFLKVDSENINQFSHSHSEVSFTY